MDIVEALKTEEYAIGPYRKGQKIFSDYLRERREAAAEISKLREALKEIYNLPGEVNVNNYDHSDVEYLNANFIEAITIAEAALAKAG